jgi:hypothetical protein
VNPTLPGGVGILEGGVADVIGAAGGGVGADDGVGAAGALGAAGGVGGARAAGGGGGTAAVDPAGSGACGSGVAVGATVTPATACPGIDAPPLSMTVLYLSTARARTRTRVIARVAPCTHRRKAQRGKALTRLFVAERSLLGLGEVVLEVGICLPVVVRHFPFACATRPWKSATTCTA